MSFVQSVVFSKEFGLVAARKWLANNGYSSHTVFEKDNTYRFRQHDPKQLENRGYTFRDTPFEHGIFVMAYPPGK